MLMICRPGFVNYPTTPSVNPRSKRLPHRCGSLAETTRLTVRYLTVDALDCAHAVAHRCRPPLLRPAGTVRGGRRRGREGRGLPPDPGPSGGADGCHGRS